MTPDAGTALPSVVVFDLQRRRERPPGFPLAATVLVAAAWPLARTLAPAVDCVVLTRAANCWADLEGPATELRAASRTPLVVRAGQLRAPERAAIERIPITTLVAGRVPEESAWAAVQGAASARVLVAILEGVAAVRRMPEGLRRAATLLCSTDPPPASVLALCARAGVHRRTLWYQWRTRARGRGARLEDAVMAVVLLRASVRWAAGESWREAAEQLSVDRKTLARAAKRAGVPGGLPPHRGARADAVHAAVRRFAVAKLARPLLRGQPEPGLSP